MWVLLRLCVADAWEVVVALPTRGSFGFDCLLVARMFVLSLFALHTYQIRVETGHGMDHGFLATTVTATMPFAHDFFSYRNFSG
jgi:hypothetical protein